MRVFKDSLGYSSDYPRASAWVQGFGEHEMQAHTGGGHSHSGYMSWFQDLGSRKVTLILESISLRVEKMCVEQML